MLRVLTLKTATLSLILFLMIFFMRDTDSQLREYATNANLSRHIMSVNEAM